MELIQLWGYHCHRCGHEWVPKNKTEKPRVCPKCKNPYWDRPRRDAGKESQATADKLAKRGRRKPAQSSGEVRK